MIEATKRAVSRLGIFHVLAEMFGRKFIEECRVLYSEYASYKAWKVLCIRNWSKLKK